MNEVCCAKWHSDSERERWHYWFSQILDNQTSQLSGQRKHGERKFYYMNRKFSLITSLKVCIQGTKLEERRFLLVHSHSEQCKKYAKTTLSWSVHWLYLCKIKCFWGKGEARPVWKDAEGKVKLELTPSLFVHHLQSSAEGTESPKPHHGESWGK